MEDQASFHECRRECLTDLQTELRTTSGIPYQDVVRFFHGDGPAQQVEAGAKMGGTYPCVGCTARCSMFDDVAYSFRAKKHSIADRQTFVIEGKAWRKGGTRPLDQLRVKELKDELTTRGISTDGMRKSEMEEIFDEMRAGINNVPALLQPNPEMCLSDLHLDKYETLPTEPLHDLKGHISNIMDEVQKTATGDILNEIQKIVKTVLNKETLRCSDYRKAIILIFNSLLKVDAQHDITILFQTLVEVKSCIQENKCEHHQIYVFTTPGLYMECYASSYSAAPKP